MQARLYFLVLIILTFLVSSVSLAGESANVGEAKAKASVGTSLYHIKLAEHYEKESKEMNAKAEEQRKMLEEYEEHSEYYGRAGQEFHSHHEALLREYTKAAKQNEDMAAAHRKMAK
ncbi:hypothetical protein [Nitrosomonas ureae]|uniref:DUF4398 domain-containing protein n=1 Tax=Nitrosomonas ureae TaxID=44577 RepID=A0A0S3AIG2_9PROT|nr:hypothetical protein [Nitrosomonas ureae]ALQ50956.1 hypothetical protein ATY38_06780 [Nitrosomonas ureae]SDT85143.1 hypothetical protein SAMN05216406_103101 [Nitrosomonas ureae]SEQ23756.1 hypothetical protein SAMN05421510_103026 [Nitrosomonas ureae]